MGVQAKNTATCLIYLFWFSTYCCLSEERRVLFILVLDYTIGVLISINYRLPRITRIFTNLGVYKCLYFLLSHEFSPDGELFCEYIMLQSCKSMFCYIELTLFNRRIPC